MERVLQGLAERVRVRLVVTQAVTERVLKRVVGRAVRDTHPVEDLVYVGVTLTERVKGWVLGGPVRERVLQGQAETVRVRLVVTQAVTERVLGCVL